MRIHPEETGVIIVDIQEKLMRAMWQAKECEERAVILIKGLRMLDIPMLISQQYTKGLGNSLPSVYEAAGTTKYYEKTSFSCCKDETIMGAIKEMNKKNIIVLGTEAHVCVLQTCIDLKMAGMQPILVVDSVASRKESDMKTGIQRAIQEGVLVTTSEAILMELTETSGNPHFKQISALIK
ncbi:MAG: isochorismatase family protein [Coprococcus sp.]